MSRAGLVIERGTLTPDEVAKAVGVDSAALKERMRSAEIDAVVQHDINDAKSLAWGATGYGRGHLLLGLIAESRQAIHYKNRLFKT